MKPFSFLIPFLLWIVAPTANLDFNYPQQDPTSPIIFIYDASGSMWGQIQGTTKVEIARQVLSETIDQLGPNQRIGFVAYGHRKKGDCEDVEQLADLSNTSKAIIKEQLQGIRPLGKTPLAYSALQVIEKLKVQGGKATIILLTDGIESCGGDLCEVIRQAKAAGIDFRMHIVGFGLSGEDVDPLKCAAQAGDGKYYDAGDATELTTALEEVTHQTIDEPDYNLGVVGIKNGVSIDAAVRIFMAGTKDEFKGVRTYRDTGFVGLPPGKYDLVVRPLENSDVTAQTIKDVIVEEGKMTIRTISFDAGKIQVRTMVNGEGWDATVNITLTEQSKSVSGGRTYGRNQFYEVAPGTYDVKLNCLRVKGLEIEQMVKGIVVSAQDTTLIEHNFMAGTAKIGALGKGGLLDATVNIVEKTSQRSVAGGRTYTSDSSNPKSFLLNPGEYVVTLVGVREFKGQKQSFEMTIKAGETFEKMVQY
ncbi:MAG: VWA domain-containing protein [Saprospiraceae bacterium]|nr:VWA domain-containing protein [Saprospiraceae bacterium]